MVVEPRALISISFVLNDGEYLNRLRDIVVEHSGLNKKERKNKKNGTFAFNCLPRGSWPLMSLADHKGTQKGSLGA